MRRITVGDSRRLKVPNLTEIERTGTPEDVAACYINMATGRTTMEIGRPRASSLYGACVRFHVLGSMFKLEQAQWESLTNRITFGIGRAVHEWLQNSPDVFGDRRRGWWECNGCGKILHFGAPISGPCPKCNATNRSVVYREHEVDMWGEYPATGHPDLFIDVGGALRVVEIKTIAAEAFKQLFTPLIEHQWQIAFYMWACSQGAMPVEVDPDVGYVLYISKGQLYKRLPFKMFVVKQSGRILTQIKDKLSHYAEALTTKTLPEPRQKCVGNGFDAKGTSYCDIRDFCKSMWEKKGVEG